MEVKSFLFFFILLLFGVCACVCFFSRVYLASVFQNVGWVHSDSVIGVLLMYSCFFFFSFLLLLLTFYFRYWTVFANSSYCTTSAFLQTSG